jgi:thiamine biosynthesis protein ThiS
MTIQVNGSARTAPVAMTVRALLEELGFDHQPVVVELNQRALFPREHAQQKLKDGDVIEIVQITAGG